MVPPARTSILVFLLLAFALPLSVQAALVCYPPVKPTTTWCSERNYDSCNQQNIDAQAAYDKQFAAYNTCIEANSETQMDAACQAELNSKGGNGTSEYGGESKFNGCRISCNQGYYLTTSGACAEKRVNASVDTDPTPSVPESVPQKEVVLPQQVQPAEPVQSTQPAPVKSFLRKVFAPESAPVREKTSSGEISVQEVQVEVQSQPTEQPTSTLWNHFKGFLKKLNPLSWF